MKDGTGVDQSHQRSWPAEPVALLGSDHTPPSTQTLGPVILPPPLTHTWSSRTARHHLVQLCHSGRWPT